MNENSLSKEIIAGKNAVIEALKTKTELNAVYIADGEISANLKRIVSMAKEQGIVIKQINIKKLDFLCSGVPHQGIAASISAAKYYSTDDLLETAEKEGKSPFIVIADEIEDPHNLGAVIRTAEAVGAHGVIIPKRHSAMLTAAVYKSSAGALSHIKIVRAANLASEIEYLKKRNIWIYGADMNGEPWNKADYSGGICLVIGSESSGIGRLIKDKCDFLVSLPMKRSNSSLNASVAGGVILYEIMEQRNSYIESI